MKELLIVQELSVFYQVPVVKNVSFTLHDGEVVGLIGHNGCGKSTMLKGIMGSLKQTGIVKVANEDFMAMKISQRAKNIAMLTQQVEIVAGISVYELINLGNYPHWQMGQRTDRLKILEVAKLLKIEDLLDKDYAILSEGQKQLVQLARILVQDTPVILLDEPDSRLDFENNHLIFRVIQQLIQHKNKAALIVIHNPLSALMYCNRVLLMDKGKIVNEIKPQEETCALITTKIQQLYPNIIIKKDESSQQYYYLIK